MIRLFRALGGRPPLSWFKPLIFWAAALIPAAVQAAPPASPSTPAAGPGAPVRFAQEVKAFARLDTASPPPACPILFVGSSSIRLWKSLADDMAPMPVINRGFGGAEIADVNRHFDRVVKPYKPRAIVFYAGENDLAAGKSPQQVVAEFARFMDLKSEALGGTPVFFTSLKPSMRRFQQFAAQTEVNAQVRALAEAREDLVYLDVVGAMMQDGRPKPLFVKDGLHMSPEGYALWKATVSQALADSGIASLTCDSPTMETAVAPTAAG